MKIALIDERMCDEGKLRLMKDGFYIIEMKPSKNLSAPLSSHPDMLLFYDRGTLISSASYIEEYPYIFEDIMRLVPNIHLIAEDISQKPDYPHDAVYNALKIGDKLFLKSDTASAAVLEYAKKAGLKIFETKQGYPACTTLSLSDFIAVTADRGMAKMLSLAGISVTLTENGGISLPPYEYGFIGGASGVYKSKVYFTGDVSLHQSYEKINAACQAANLTPVSLFRGELTDLGRIIFIEDNI